MSEFDRDMRPRGDYNDFSVLDLMTELEYGKRRAKPLALIARHLDVPKRKVVKLLKQAREEAFPQGILIMNNGKDSYYLRQVDEASVHEL